MLNILRMTPEWQELYSLSRTMQQAYDAAGVEWKVTVVGYMRYYVDRKD